MIESCSKRGREEDLVLRDELCTVQCPRGSEWSQLQTRTKQASLEGTLRTLIVEEPLIVCNCFQAAAVCFSIRVAAGRTGDVVFPFCGLFCGAEQHKIGGTGKEPTFAIRPCALHTPSVLSLEHQPSWAVEISNVLLLPSLEWLRWNKLCGSLSCFLQSCSQHTGMYFLMAFFQNLF